MIGRPLPARVACWLSMLALCGAASCATVSAPAAPPPPADLIVDAPRRIGMPVIFVAMPSAPAFRAVRRTLVGELQKTFDVQTFVVGRETSPAALGSAIEGQRPSAVVLMDNPTVTLYRDWERTRPKDRPPLPVIVVMSSFVDEFRAELANATAIAYEVPGVSAFVNLRSIIEKPVTRVGVVHRPRFRGFIERQKTLAAQEQIELIGLEIEGDVTPENVKAALTVLHKERNIDALWVLNDNALLKSGEFVQRVWRPTVELMSIPVIVGAANLVSAVAPFGTFAVLPDHDALGVQTANVVFELAEDEWRAGERDIELPVSTVTVADLDQIRLLFGLRADAASRIDIALEK